MRRLGPGIPLGFALRIRTRVAQAKSIFHVSGLSRQIFLRIAVDVDNTLFVILGNGAIGSNKSDRVPEYACGTIRRAAADADIPAGIVDGHIAVEVADLAVYLHIGDGGIGETALIIDFAYQLGLGIC